MVKSTATSVRHKMESPVAVKSNSAVPRTFRQIHCIMNFATHAQPMIVMNDRPKQDIPSDVRQVPAFEGEPEGSILRAHLGADPSEETGLRDPRQRDGDEFAVVELIGVAVRELSDPNRHRPGDENVPDVARLAGELQRASIGQRYSFAEPFVEPRSRPWRRDDQEETDFMTSRERPERPHTGNERRSRQPSARNARGPSHRRQEAPKYRTERRSRST